MINIPQKKIVSSIPKLEINEMIKLEISDDEPDKNWKKGIIKTRLKISRKDIRIVATIKIKRFLEPSTDITFLNLSMFWRIALPKINLNSLCFPSLVKKFF